MNDRIHRVGIRINKEGISYYNTELPCSIGKVLISVDGMRIKKENILKPETWGGMYAISLIDYHTYCHSEDVELAKQIVREAAMYHFQRISDEFIPIQEIMKTI